MYLVSDFTKPVYRIGEVARILGVTTETLRIYDEQGKLETIRSEGGHRRVTREALLGYLNRQGMLFNDTERLKRDVIYARVSSNDQMNDLDRQVMYIIEHQNNLQSPLVLKEIGSGLNDKRTQLQKLIGMVMQDEVRSVFVTCEDRLTRFGFYYLETFFRMKGVEIVVLNNRAANNEEQELVDDMMSLIASFSGKLYGLRSGENKKAGTTL